MCRPSITVEGRKKKEKIKDKKSQRRRRLQKKKIKVGKLELATCEKYTRPIGRV
jgi:hypothetical protein